MSFLRNALLVILMAVLSQAAVATTITVDIGGSGDFETIQEAVDIAVTGDTLLIRAGLYEENVHVVGPCLTWIGEGSDATVIRAPAPEPAILLQDLDSPPGCSTVRDLTIESYGEGVDAIYARTSIDFYDCDLLGHITVTSGDGLGGGIGLRDCSATSVSVAGGYRASYIERSTLNSGRFYGVWVENWGHWYCLGHNVYSADSSIGSLSLSCAFLESASDDIGPVSGDEQSGCRGVGSQFESVEIEGGVVELEDCIVSGDVTLIGTVYDAGAWAGRAHLARCLVGGDLMVDVDQHSYGFYGLVWVIHNTILGDFSCNYDIWSDTTLWPHHIRGNIVMGATQISDFWVHETWPPVVSHNDFVGGSVITAQPDSVYANFSAAPLLCDDIDYELQECSPCVGAAHDGGEIGARAVGCPCYAPVEQLSWGAIKALYRQPSN